MRRELLVLIALCASASIAGCRTRVGPQRVELWFGGDVHASARLGALLDKVSVGSTAVGVVNLEGPIAEGPAAAFDTNRVSLRQGAQVPALLSAAGVRVATLANNHALDAGEQGRRETVRRLAAAHVDAVYGEHRAVIRAGDTTISMVAFDLTDGVPPSLGAVVARSRGLRIVALHVGGKPSYLPSDTLQTAVDNALRAGAKVVVAHGSHEPAKVERRGDAVIAWGLGNLVFDCECTRETDGLILRLQATEGSLSAAVLPIHAGLDGAPARPNEDVDAMLALLASLGSSPLERDGDWFSF